MTKNLERKKKEQIKGRTDWRMPICNPTIQLVVVDLYTKYEVSILNGCGDIFDEKVLRNYGRTDGTTDSCKPVYPPPPPLFQSGGIIIKKLSLIDFQLQFEKISRIIMPKEYRNADHQMEGFILHTQLFLMHERVWNDGKQKL